MRRFLLLYKISCHLFLLILFLVDTSLITSVYAQSDLPNFQDTSKCRFAGYREPFIDGHPVALILSCAFATDHDTVMIFPPGNVNVARTWQSYTDGQPSVWVFDAGSQSRASLIIQFRSIQNKLSALLYDDQNGDSQVSYSVNERGQVTVEETNYPTVVMYPKDNWWIKDGQVNFNLEMIIDGKVVAAFGAEEYLNTFRNDNAEDYHIWIHDTDEDGRPDYQIIQSLAPVPDSFGIIRSLIMVNPKDDELPITNAILWPYLGSVYKPLDFLTENQESTIPFLPSEKRTSGLIKTNDQSFPPIQISWPQAKIGYVGEFVASRGNDHNWFVYSINRLKQGDPTEATFEAPFAFYDLAEDRDRYPELQIRHDYTVLNDNILGYNQVAFPLRTQNIRYSWDQDNNGSWDFKVDLVGRYPITNTVSLSETTFLAPDYNYLPEWVISKPWDAATFVAAERDDIRTSEGIYEWSASPLRDYFLYNKDRLVLYPYNSITPGMRGEFRLISDEISSLYVSSIDHKVHLTQADQGIWQIDKNSTMRYANLNGDNYIDQWTYTRVITGEQSITTTRQLNIAQNYAFYSDDQSVRIRMANIAPALFETLPPSDHDSWLVLSAKLDASAPSFEATDLAAMFAQFQGSETAIDNGQLRDYRVIDKGYRFVLELKPGFRVQGSDIMGIQNLSAGVYSVVFDGAFHVEPLTAPNISLRLLEQPMANVGMGQPVPLQIIVTNTGLEDRRNLELVATMSSNGEEVEFARSAVDAFANLTQSIDLTWKPPAAGTWTLQLRLEDSASSPIVVQQQIVHVQAQTPSESRVAHISSSAMHNLPVIVLLGMIACFMGSVVVLVLRAQQTKERV